MASRLRPPGGIKPPGVSKLARPGLRSPSGLARSSPQSAGDNVKVARQPPATGLAVKRPQQQQQQQQQVRPQPADPEGGGAANGEHSFELGDRVLFNGKCGVLAFLGTTQFAKGNWAGIVLDSLEGKNNGSVNGVQYFECEPNRGLFAKQEKIQFVSKGNQSSKPAQPAQGGPASTNGQQFEVGDSVLVDGQKEGMLGFIGTTQFARGVWAGVILDAPDGKNDGSVSGIKYFECEPNHGLFTRPQKLKLISKAASVGSTPPRQLPPSRTPQDEGQRSTSQTPVDLKVLQNKLNIGDHVLVGGIKEGILRYLGPTEFAKGIWVGVELPEPMGKNDGAISGKRYFQCEPKHGLFAPILKVEKLATAGSEGVPSLAASSPTSSPYHSPSMAKATMEHSRARHLSGSSITSGGSSRLLQDAFMAGSLQGTTATDLSVMLQERDAEIETLQATLDQREREKVAHQEELTELRRHVDDLQFQLEEQGVISGDQLESATETNVQQLTDLSRELEEERRLTQQLRDQLKSNEGSGGSATAELHNKVEEMQGKLEERTQEVSSHLATITRLTEELQHARAEAMANSSSSNSTLDQELQQTREQLEAERGHRGSLQQELAQTQSDLEAERNRLAMLQQDHNHVKEGLQGASDHSSSLEAEIAQMESTILSLQGEVSSSNQGMQEAMELCSQHEALIEERNRELSSLEERIRLLSKEQEVWAGERSRLQSEHARLLSERDKAIAECDRLMTQSSNSSMEQNELSQQRRELLSERDTLLGQQRAMQTEHEKLTIQRDELLHQLKELQDQKQDVLNISQEVNLKYSTAQGELMQAKAELKQLELELSTSRETWEHDKLNLQEQMELARTNAIEIEQRISSTALERDATLQEAQDLVDKLEKIQQERDDLKVVLENAQVQVEELQFQLDELNSRHQSLEKESTTEVLEVQQKLEATEILLAERERELSNAQEKLTSLSDDLVISQGKNDVALLEEEKLLLEERVKELILQLERAEERGRRDSKALESLLAKPANSDNESTSGRLEEAQIQLLEAQTQQENLLQEIEDYRQQTEFLNSVISDLQNKLEGVEAMKGLHGAMDSVSEYIEEEDPLLDNLPPPRLFCDICDVFDQHDTDDCPMQTMASDSPPHSMHHGGKAPGGSDRPYCENCEVFGHWTDQCEYEATY